MFENYNQIFFWRIRANFNFKLPKHFFYLWKSLQTFFDVCRKIVFDFFLALMYGVKLSKILYNFPEHIKKGLQRFSKIKKVFRKLKIKNSSRFARMNVMIHFVGYFQTLWYISVFSKVNRILMFMCSAYKCTYVDSYFSILLMPPRWPPLMPNRTSKVAWPAFRKEGLRNLERIGSQCTLRIDICKRSKKMNE